MSTYAVEKLVNKMEEENILIEKALTPKELTEQLLKFQNLMATLVLEGENLETARLDAVIYKMESIARANGISQDIDVRRCMQDLRAIEKEISISVAGRNGESRVARTLSYVTRPKTSFYQNVYVANDEKETEIDTIVLTNQGIIVLEVKNSKTDITITEDGRLLYSNESCFHEKSICEKMKDKRQLLTEKLKSKIETRGVDIPVRIDSYVVFSAPKGIHVNITDNCRREKYCSRGKLPYMINDYVGATYYSEEQLEILKGILSEMESSVKKFEIGMNFDQIRREVAMVLVKLMPDKFECSEQVVHIEERSINTTPRKGNVRHNNRKNKYAKYIASVACVAGAAVVPIAGVMVASMITRTSMALAKMRV